MPLLADSICHPRSPAVPNPLVNNVHLRQARPRDVPHHVRGNDGGANRPGHVCQQRGSDRGSNERIQTEAFDQEHDCKQGTERGLRNGHDAIEEHVLHAGGQRAVDTERVRGRRHDTNNAVGRHRRRSAAVRNIFPGSHCHDTRATVTADHADADRSQTPATWSPSGSVAALSLGEIHGTGRAP